MSGAPGHTGHTGTTGRRGLQGTPYGAPGTTFYSTSGRVTTSAQSGPEVSVQAVGYGITYLLSGSRDAVTITFPSVMSSNDYGAFWTFRNLQDGVNKTLNLVNTAGVVYNGNSSASNVILGFSNSLTFVFSDGSNTTSTYIAI